MRGNETGTGADDGLYDGNPPPSWYRPLGSILSARLLTQLVIERLRATTWSGPMVGGGGVEVDGELGIVRSRDGGWSATLAPLAARLAHIPPEGWSMVVDREVERWQEAVTDIGRSTRIDGPGCLPPDQPSIVLRLTTAFSPRGRALRPAFGNIAWELVRDLGAGGRASLSLGDVFCRTAADSERFWDRIAAETVVRHEKQWAGLPLDGVMGVILSGPHVSALLYDPERLRDRVEEQMGGAALRAGVITNSLLLITESGEANHPIAQLLAESLRRFASGPHRHFDPFTVEL